nr:MAG TPA: PROTEIN G PROTEIN G OF BOVINE [Caudoviricetes sp.]
MAFNFSFRPCSTCLQVHLPIIKSEFPRFLSNIKAFL